jgi:hypothetical protein
MWLLGEAETADGQHGRKVAREVVLDQLIG